ncbi:hypothetical protein IKQ74_03280 [Candidatus Saccharibacteria bacterium]|nr:hypothetical protein [Candidatus Saccharibacteria bacterium]
MQKSTHKPHKGNHNNKKLFIVISVVAVIAIIITIAIIMSARNPYEHPYRIPAGYTKVETKDMSTVDGAKTTFYFYPDKVIQETISEFPSGHPCNCSSKRVITIYPPANTINEVYKLKGESFTEYN